MPTKINDTVSKIKDYWSGLEFKAKRRILFWGMLCLIAVAVATVVLNRTEYAVLYSELDLVEAGEVSNLLKELGIKSTNSGNGTILVEKSREEDIRMQLAVQGYPKSGLNYDLYLNNINFSTSTHDKNVMLLYQLQDRLSNTIKLLQGISDAVVTISMDMTDNFQLGNDITPVSANVLLELETNFSPSVEQIRAIQRLMITSISGLKDENVVIIDSEANDLLPMNNSDPATRITNSQLELKKNVETNLRDKILYMFEPVFGEKNIKVAVNATFNFDKTTTEVTEYSPVVNGEGIPFLIDELSEQFSDSTTNMTAGSDSLNERVQRVVNYRINELRRTIEEAQGVIQDISISILINDTELDEDGLFNVSQIVGAAVDVDTANINVSNMDFSANAAKEQQIKDALEAAKANREEPLPISEQTIIGLVAMFFSFIFALLLLRTMRKALAKPKVVVEGPAVSELEELLDEAKAAISEEELRRNESMEKIQEERQMIEEITQIVRVNPRNAAELIAYWLERGETNEYDDSEVVE